MPDPNDEWLTERTEDQQREDSEIVMMISQIDALGLKVEYQFRGYDNKHLVEVLGVKCYGQSPQAHAFLSGALVVARHYEWMGIGRNGEQKYR